MNKRLKKKMRTKVINCYTTKAKRNKNKMLCRRYPFLIPRNVFSDRVIWAKKPYDITLADVFPKGWWKAFGIQLCEEIREDCLNHNYLYQLRFNQIKEKYGGLRIYTGPIPKDSKIDNIIDDYSSLSQYICLYCGKPDVHMIDWGGWLTPVCEDCFNRINKRNLRYGYYKSVIDYVDLICENDMDKMPDKRTARTWHHGVSWETDYDLTEKAEKIRARWKVKHNEV